MAHEISWDNEDKTVILQQYTIPATKDDLYRLAAKSAEMIKSVEHTIHLIIDERAIKLMLTSADLNYLEKNVPPNQGAVVTIVNKTDVAYKSVVQAIGHKLAPNAFDQPFFADSIEEARAFLIENFSVRYP